MRYENIVVSRDPWCGVGTAVTCIYVVIRLISRDMYVVVRIKVKLVGHRIRLVIEGNSGWYSSVSHVTEVPQQGAHSNEQDAFFGAR